MSHYPTKTEGENSPCTIDELRELLRNIAENTGNPALATYIGLLIAMDEIIQKNSIPELKPIADAVQVFRQSVAEFTPSQITTLLNRTCQLLHVTNTPPPADIQYNPTEAMPKRLAPILKQDIAPKTMDVGAFSNNNETAKRGVAGQPSAVGIFSQSASPERSKNEVTFNWTTASQPIKPNSPFVWNTTAEPAVAAKTLKQRNAELLCWIDHKIRSTGMPDECLASFTANKEFLSKPGITPGTIKGLASPANL